MKKFHLLIMLFSTVFVSAKGHTMDLRNSVSNKQLLEKHNLPEFMDNNFLMQNIEDRNKEKELSKKRSRDPNTNFTESQSEDDVKSVEEPTPDKKRTKTTKRGRRDTWTDEEVQILKEHKNSGTSWEKLSKIIKDTTGKERTPLAVKVQFYKIT
jgi:hypothetical protein